MSTPPTTVQPAAGWYPDPENSAQQRYWSGSEWTEHYSPSQAAGPESVPPPIAAPAAGQVAPAPIAERQPTKVGIFGARGKAKELDAEVVRLREQLDQLGALSLVELDEQRQKLEAQVAELQATQESERVRLEAQLAELRKNVVTTEEAQVLQEVGIYEYRHPLSDSVLFKSQLELIKQQIKLMTRKDGGAISATTNWTVNNSASQGRTMVRDFSKLMLRAYNAEADNLVRSLKPYKLDSAIERLTKVATTIVRLGKTMDIRISDQYHRLRLEELALTADYQQKLAEEKEAEREEKARLREERKAQQEMEAERKRLEKERTHYQNALEALIAKGDVEAAAKLRAQLEDVDKAIEDVDYRAANIRAGYVYVISNLGSFGEEIIKIGMTRRIEPMDRVRELSDASVPFNFDLHALFFAEDAVGIEAELHRRLAEKRVNRVNLRREFFYATPAEVKVELLDVAGDILEYKEAPEALEYHQSASIVANNGSAQPATVA